MRNGLVALLAGLLSTGLSGCAGGPDSPSDDGATPVVITDPSQNRTSADQRPHLHDYWRNERRLTVMEAEQEVGGITWLDESAISVASFRPDEGRVVPQGAAWVNVTISWDNEADDNRWQQPQLWAKSANDNDLQLIADLEGPEPQTVSIPTTNFMDDLPHQVLSAWQFDLFMQGTPTGLPDGATTWLSFSGTVHIVVTTDRGLEIPLYPGHPDAWGSRTEITLFESGGQLLYDGDPTTGNWRCYGGCPVIHVPDEGVIVPYDTDHVTVTIGYTYGAPSTLGLKYHGADARDYEVADVSNEGQNTREYTIQARSAGDGPYARQSQWEFAPWVEGPVPNGYIFEEYTIKAVAYRT